MSARDRCSLLNRFLSGPEVAMHTVVEPQTTLSPGSESIGPYHSHAGLVKLDFTLTLYDPVSATDSRQCALRKGSCEGFYEFGLSGQGLV